MINILRTHQVRAAQKGVPTGLVYKQNEERLASVGTKVLEGMLYDRKWDDLPWLNPRAARPIKDASAVSINWKTVSPLLYSSAPKEGSDLMANDAPSACPFSKSEQDALLRTNTKDDILLLKDSVKSKDDILLIKDRYLSGKTTHSSSTNSPNVVGVMDNLKKLSDKGIAEESDYVNFADDILRWLEDQENQGSVNSSSEENRKQDSNKEIPFTKSKVKKTSEDVDW